MDPMLLLSIASFGLNLFGTSLSMSEKRDQEKVQVAEAKANIPLLEDYLARFPEFSDFTQAQYREAGTQQFRQLAGAAGEANVLAGMTGQVGGGASMSLVAEQKREDVVRFAGEDLSITQGTEGLYAQGLEVLRGNLEAQRKSAEAQLGVWKTTLDVVDKSQEREEAKRRASQPDRHDRAGGGRNK